MAQPRLSVRGLVVQDDKLLLVNATPDPHDGKWCTPGGGIDAGEDLKFSLKREILEETGLDVDVRDICAINEFFNEADNFHQIDLFFAASVIGGTMNDDWIDPANVVVHRGFFTLDEMQEMDVFPAFLKQGAWLQCGERIYKGMERK